MSEVNYIIHSSGPWKKHKYIRKVGDRYYYTKGLEAEQKYREAKINSRVSDRLANDAENERIKYYNEYFGEKHPGERPTQMQTLADNEEDYVNRHDPFGKRYDPKVKDPDGYDLGSTRNAYSNKVSKRNRANHEKIRDQVKLSEAEKELAKNNKEGNNIVSKTLLKAINAGSKAKDLATEKGQAAINKGKDFVNSLKSKFSK